MNIALLGYGKMGKAIEAIAMERGHSITLRVDADNRANLKAADLKGSDTAIEFSTPDSAVENMKLCFSAGIPVITGTTGWYGELDAIRQACEQNSGALVHATNFSIGVNIFFQLNRQLARVMNKYGDYDVRMTEIHHTQKLDAPSGTAITLAEGILAEVDRKNKWVNHSSSEATELSIRSERTDEVPGTHEITYTSVIDDISIKHTAHNRKGFALGAVVAAEWILGKQGVYTMADVLNVNFS